MKKRGKERERETDLEHSEFVKRVIIDKEGNVGRGTKKTKDKNLERCFVYLG